jgi:hypothetical protein
MTKKTLQMDTCLDFSNPATLEFLAYLERNNILFSVLEWYGPGGGNPVCSFTATDEVLRNMLNDEEGFGCYDDEDVEFYMSEWTSDAE